MRKTRTLRIRPEDNTTDPMPKKLKAVRKEVEPKLDRTFSTLVMPKPKHNTMAKRVVI